jgi:hypothetical protein
MIDLISLVVSVFALGVSGLTAWLTLLRKGTVLMTRPTVIFFGPDGGLPADDLPLKVYLRTLLYATSKRGVIVESMYVRVRRGETSQNFNIWTYGDKRLSRGSGLFVSESGVAANHHFLLPADGTAFYFLEGNYTLQIFASVVGEQDPHLLHSVQLAVTSHQASVLKKGEQGLYFDWSPDGGKYHSSLHSRPAREAFSPFDFLSDRSDYSTIHFPLALFT